MFFYDLKKSGLSLQKEVPRPIIYEEVKLDYAYRTDLLLENKIVIEI
jgi:GxxExxY protein